MALKLFLRRKKMQLYTAHADVASLTAPASGAIAGCRESI